MAIPERGMGDGARIHGAGDVPADDARTPTSPGDLPDGVRIEVLDRGHDGTRGGLIVLRVGPPGARECLGIALAQRDDGDWLLGHGAVAEDMVAGFLRHALPMRPLTGTAMSRLGLHGNYGDLVGDCLRALTGEASFHDVVVDETNPDEGPGGNGTIDPSGADLLGYAMPAPWGCLMRAPCEETAPRVPPLASDEADTVRRALLAWQSAMGAMLSPHGTTPLRPPTWTPATCRLLADPSHGRYRMQAVSLYPALAPFVLGLFPVAAGEEVAPLVDAGRPFERRLAALVSSTVIPGERPLDLARLRRLRTIPGHLWGGDVLALVRTASRIPADGLPREALGWRNLAAALRATHRFAAGTGLPRSRLVGGRDAWPFSTMQLDDELTDALDVVTALADGLVRPALRRIGLRVSQRHPGRIAGHMLFEGLGSRAVVDLSHRWHGAGRMESPDAGNLSWEALFPDYDHGDGIRISCLTTSAALSAEGAWGRDGNGVEGLAHCVGTYDRRCAAGEVHVASVSRIEGNGRRTRLSTLSLTAVPSEGRIHARVDQHRGLRNAGPCPEARAAVAALVGWLDGLPFPGRVGAAASGSDDPAPDALLVADRAWQAYLRPRHRRRDLAGTIALVATLAERIGDGGTP